MSSLDVRRSVSRGRSRTPANVSVTDNNPGDRPNGTRSRSPSHDSRRSRSRSHRERSYNRSATRSRSPDLPPSAKVVIEKLTKNVNEGHLHEIFSSYGAIQELEMPLNRQFMMNKGIAYILYTNAEHAEDAIAHMHEAQLDGALINVSIVLPRRRFSQSPPARRLAPNRFGEANRFRAPAPRPPPADRAFGGRPPPPRASPPYSRGSRRSPPPRHDARGGAPYRDRYDDRADDRASYRPRSYSPSRSPPPRRRGEPSRNISRSPERGGRRRRSPSYSSYGSRSRSHSRDRGPGRR